MDILRVKDGKIVDTRGQPVRLRGVCIGGWMNMENFINGYPGAEHTLRETMAQILGPAKARFFFDRWLDYFFAEEDVAFIKASGATVVRLPLNYRHFESDAEPFHYLEAGFERLDRALEWCAKYGVYAILDLHAVQGWQNTDWHCDNSTRHTLFWHHRQFQDRFVALWEEFARRYVGNPVVAGYNVMNEPITGAPYGRFSDVATPDWEAINHVYRRVTSAIRAIDPDHIVFLEGDYWSTLFAGFDEPFAENLVYSTHNYNIAGSGPGPYPGLLGGEYWDRQKQVQVFLEQEGTRFTQKHHVPLWVGEFGCTLNGPPEELASRYRACSDQIGVFEEYGAHWTIWTYKDLGRVGWVRVTPESEYMQVIAPILKAKELLGADFHVSQPSATVAKSMRDLARLTEETIGDPDIDPNANQRYLIQHTLGGYVATLMQPAYAKCFRGMSEAEIDRMLQSFALKNCQPSEGLLDVLKGYMAHPA